MRCLPDQMPVVSLDLPTADDTVLSALADHQNRILIERLPDDPPVPVAARREAWLSPAAGTELRFWAVWHPDRREIIGHAWTDASTTAENHHVARFRVSVLPEYRRQGIGRSLLAAVAGYAIESKRQVLVSPTNNRQLAGALWMARIGARPSVTVGVNQLALADVDRHLLDRWILSARERAADCELGFWVGPYPAESLAAICDVHNALQSAERLADTIEHTPVTPEQLRMAEQSLATGRSARWTAYVTERPSGSLLGLSEVWWGADRPEVIHQLFTGVYPEHRNRGLGRWLKAAMLQKILSERPAARYIRTENRVGNVPILHINAALGFTLYSEDVWWELELAGVQRYLGLADRG